MATNLAGVDPTPDQWREISALLKEKDVYIVFDNAYQGFASGDATRDAFSIRHVRAVCVGRLRRTFASDVCVGCA